MWQQTQARGDEDKQQASASRGARVGGEETVAVPDPKRLPVCASISVNIGSRKHSGVLQRGTSAALPPQSLCSDGPQGRNADAMGALYPYGRSDVQAWQPLQRGLVVTHTPGR
jgi:hypothetical protein